MEEEEEERLRQPPIVQEPEPEEERERHRGSRDHRERRQEPERADSRSRPPQSDNEVEEGEEEDYDNDEDNPDVKPRLKPTMRPITAAPSVSSASGNVSPNTPGEESPCGIIIPHENSPPEALPQEEHRPKIGLSLKLGESKRSFTSLQNEQTHSIPKYEFNNRLVDGQKVAKCSISDKKKFITRK